MITEEEISHQNNNIFDLSHPNSWLENMMILTPYRAILQYLLNHSYCSAIFKTRTREVSVLRSRVWCVVCGAVWPELTIWGQNISQSGGLWFLSSAGHTSPVISFIFAPRGWCWAVELQTNHSEVAQSRFTKKAPTRANTRLFWPLRPWPNFKSIYCGFNAGLA